MHINMVVMMVHNFFDKVSYYLLKFLFSRYWLVKYSVQTLVNLIEITYFTFSHLKLKSDIFEYF